MKIIQQILCLAVYHYKHKIWSKMFFRKMKVNPVERYKRKMLVQKIGFHSTSSTKV